MLRLLSITLLLSLFVWHIAGHYGAVVVATRVIQSQIQEAIQTLPEEKLITLNLSESDFEWRDEGEEIYFQSQWYDVVSAKQASDGEWVIRCVADMRETALMASLVNPIGGNLTAPLPAKKITLSNTDFVVQLNAKPIAMCALGDNDWPLLHEDGQLGIMKEEIIPPEKH